MQKALKEGRLQFGEKPKMQVDTDPLKVEEALYSEPYDCFMVEAADGLDEAINADSFECMMVETTDGSDKKDEAKLEAVYPQAGEDLTDFQEKC